MWVNYNGCFYPDSAVPIAASDLAWQYGFSLFETMRWTGKRIPLFEKHFQRLASGLQTLQMKVPSLLTPDFLQEEVYKTIKRNNITGDARVRLQVSPSQVVEGKLEGIHYKIEASPCEKLCFRESGLEIGLTKEPFSPNALPLAAFKTGNYLPYFLASLEAKRRELDEILLLNNYKRIGEASASNVFWTQNGQLFTPPLSENIVAGVGRSRLIEVLSQAKETVQEALLTPERLRQADAVYLTNAFQGLRWVARCEGIVYKPNKAKEVFHEAFVILT